MVLLISTFINSSFKNNRTEVGFNYNKSYAILFRNIHYSVPWGYSNEKYFYCVLSNIKFQLVANVNYHQCQILTINFNNNLFNNNYATYSIYLYY